MVLVGTGPSASKVDLEACRGLAKVFAIKGSWRLAPWADAIYGLDREWWIVNQGVPDFVGWKFTPSPTAARVFGLTQIRLKARDEILTGELGTVGCGLRSGGGFSGFQTINLAVQFGACRIVLVGFDMTLKNGAHWHPHAAGTGKPEAGRTESWRKSLDAVAPRLSEMGMEVINASAGSALTAYRKVAFEDIKWQ